MTSNTVRSSAFTDELWHSIEPIYAAMVAPTSAARGCEQTTTPFMVSPP